MSIRPRARGKIPANPCDELKDRFVQLFETEIGKALISPPIDGSSDRLWHNLRPFDPKWERLHGVYWSFPVEYRYLREKKLSEYTNDEIEKCHDLLDSKKICVKKGLRGSISDESVSKSSKYFLLSHEQCKSAVFVVLSRFLIAMLSPYQKEQYIRLWSIQFMITNDGAEGFPGYRWKFPEQGPGLKEFTRPSIASWSKETCVSFLQSIEDGTLLVEKMYDYEVSYPLEPVQWATSESKSYGYVNAHKVEYCDAELIPHITPSSSETFRLNKLFGSEAAQFEPKETVNPASTVNTPSNSIEADRAQFELFKEIVALKDHLRTLEGDVTKMKDQASRFDAAMKKIQAQSDKLSHAQFEIQSLKEQIRRLEHDKLEMEKQVNNLKILQKTSESVDSQASRNDELGPQGSKAVPSPSSTVPNATTTGKRAYQEDAASEKANEFKRFARPSLKNQNRPDASGIARPSFTNQNRSDASGRAVHNSWYSGIVKEQF